MSEQTSLPEVSSLSFEQAVEELEKIVAALERGAAVSPALAAGSGAISDGSAIWLCVEAGLDGARAALVVAGGEGAAFAPWQKRTDSMAKVSGVDGTGSLAARRCGAL